MRLGGLKIASDVTNLLLCVFQSHLAIFIKRGQTLSDDYFFRRSREQGFRVFVSRFHDLIVVPALDTVNESSMLPADVLQLWQAVAGSLKRP